MNRYTLGLTAAAIALGGAALHAAPGGMRGDKDNDGSITRAEAQAMAAGQWTRMDVNKDGKLDSADRDARMAERFASIDTDRNGAISREEFAAHHGGMQGSQKAAGAQDHEGHGNDRRKGHRMGRGGGMGHGPMAMMADADKDGAVTRAEFDAGTKAMFDRADTNKDGNITGEERKAARERMRQMRTDRAAPGA